MLLTALMVLQTAPTFDSHARTAIGRMVAAYRALGAYSAEVQTANAAAEIAYRKPGRIVVAAKDGKVNPALVDPIARVVADGRFVYSLSPKRPTRYLKGALQGEASLFERAIDPVLQGGFVRFLLRGDDPLQTFAASGPSVRLQGLRMGEADSLDGQAVERVVASFEDGARHQTIDVEFEIGVADHLLRRLSFRPQGAPPEARRVVETHRNVRANPALDDATFAFVPPRGAVAVAEFETPLHPDLRVGARPFPLDARDLAGRPVGWSSYRGKVVLLDFWATWCMPCVAAIPELVALRKTYGTRGFEIVSVSADRFPDRAKLAGFVAKHGMAWPQIHDATGRLAQLYAVKAYPTTLIVGRDGRVLAVNPRGDELAAAVRRAVEAPKP